MKESAEMKCPYCRSDSIRTLETRGLQRACEKRPVTMEQIRGLAERVRQDLMMKGKGEISSQEIGDSL